MMDTFRTVTVRSLLNTAAFGKPNPSPDERRNSLLWGHPSPLAEHKLLVLLGGVLALLLAAAALAGALSLEGESGRPRAEPDVSIPHTSVVIVEPLA